MATYEIIAWRDIPMVVEARDGPESVTHQLSDRFQALIDSAAMQLGLEASDAYLEEWTRSMPEQRPGSAAAVAAAVAQELEDRFPEFITRAFQRP
jgi:cvfA/B/C family virulence factor